MFCMEKLKHLWSGLQVVVFAIHIQKELGQSMFYKITYAPSEDSDQPAHPHSLIRVFEGHSVDNQGSKVFSGGRRKQ